jgi:hypothetical protein
VNVLGLSNIQFIIANQSQEITQYVLHHLFYTVGAEPLKNHIYLHMNHLPSEVLKEGLPGISEIVAIFPGVAVTKEPLSVLNSKVHPLQFLAPLAYIVMDIIAGKYSSDSEVTRVTGKHTSVDVDVHKLRNPLELLSETEKQLKQQRTSLHGLLLPCYSLT